MEEIWKDIKGYEGLYRISNFGNVLGVKRGKLLKHYVKTSCSTVRMVCCIRKDLVTEVIYIHLIVYSHFAGEVNGMIDFKDGNPHNCSVINLIDVDKTMRFKKAHCIKVLNTTTMKLYDSIGDLAKELNIDQGTLYNRLTYIKEDGSKFYSHYKLID